MHMLYQTRRIFPALFFLALVLASCSNSTATTTTTPAQDLRVLADPAYLSAAGLSPHDFGYAGLARLLWAPLITHDAQWNITSDGLAPSPTISSDGLTYTFHLRQGVKYSDGTLVTAQDLSFDLRYDIMTGHPKIKGNNGLGNTATRYYSNVVGAAAVFAGNVPADEFNAAPVSGVQALDSSTLQIQLVHRDPGFLYALMVDPPSAVKPADIQRGEGKHYTNNQYWTTEPGVAFSGPMSLQSYTPNQGMVMVPNPDFYGTAAKLKKISVTFVTDHASAITAFQNKEADWLDISLTAADVQNAETDSYLKSTLVRGDTNSVEELYISAYKPMDDIHVRRAIYMALDKNSLVKVLDGNTGLNFYTPIVSHIANANACPGVTSTITPMPYDPTGAKAELAQSKYGAAVKNMPINIQLGLFGEDLAQNKIEAQFIQQALQTTLGFTNIQIQASPITDFSKPPYPTQLWPNEQGNRDPDLYGFLNNLVPSIATAPIPASGPSSMFELPYVPQVTSLMQQAFAAPTIAARCQILGKVLQAWVDNAVTIDLYTDSGYTMVAPWVKNLHTADGLGGLEDLYLNPGIEDTSIAAH
jgi:ABC-type transport system substrate-binding protein